MLNGNGTPYSDKGRSGTMAEIVSIVWPPGEDIYMGGGAGVLILIGQLRFLGPTLPELQLKNLLEPSQKNVLPLSLRSNPGRRVPGPRGSAT